MIVPFLIAILTMVIGHIFKVKRWGLFISVYEEPSDSNLLNAMTFGHTLNTLLPFRIGEIIRIAWSGRKLKNGYPFAFATVMADLYVDFMVVGAMFFCLSFLRPEKTLLVKISWVYTSLFIIIMIFTFIGIAFRKQIKKVIISIAGIFNDKIEFGMLYVSYLCIASLKAIVKKINKVKFAFYTFFLWTFYLLSYLMFAVFLRKQGYDYYTSDIFAKLFSGSSLYNIEKDLIIIWGMYIIIPLFLCFLISLIIRKHNPESGRYTMALPQMNQADKLAFLKTYYEDEEREHIQAYLGLNKDVMILEDKSAGSNASTMIIMKKDGNLFYRKYAFDRDGEKLQDQIDWINQHQKDIPLPIIVEQCHEGNFVAYDMHCYGNGISMFQYIHTMPIEQGWKIIEHMLDDISKGIHSKNVRKSDEESIDQYLNLKVDRNLAHILEQDRYIKQLETYDSITVNGTDLKTMRFYQTMLSKEHMKEIFSEDIYSDIHGDLTIENIICLGDHLEIDKNEYKGKMMPEQYYLIDPNTGNIHESAFLDYAKILQSLHGNYEFLMKVTSVKINGDNVNFLMIKSEAYYQLYEKYKLFLKDKFNKTEILSIYYHEIIHWIRLIPYKVKKDEKLAVVFYIGLLNILKDVWEMENAK